MSTVVRSEVAGRSAGIDWRRGFDPIDRSISVDSRTIFSSLIQQLFRKAWPNIWTVLELMLKSDNFKVGTKHDAQLASVLNFNREFGIKNSGLDLHSR